MRVYDINIPWFLVIVLVKYAIQQVLKVGLYFAKKESPLIGRFEDRWLTDWPFNGINLL